jgi:diaminohydroxyphosphoribosylaminopyrimidine deaminase / 5-amino-6-(5-phosphoribosylamino)uracil reductase
VSSSRFFCAWREVVDPEMEYMERALELGTRALGWCSPNPAVGAVIERDGVIVGEGFTQAPGKEHAEILALREAGAAAAGASLYVTLEPCSHFGRTPPCTEAIIASRIRSVHAAILDPSPWVNGDGIRALERAGIETVVGEHAADAARANEAYFKWVRTRLPFVSLKYAMTADGKIATRTGSSFWITGLEARRHVSRLRSTVDAVLVGMGTVLADDPRLTARPGEVGLPELEPAHQPLRVVMDSEARTPLDAKLVSGALPGKTLVCTTRRASPDRLRALEELGVETAVLPDTDGHVDVCATMRLLGERDITSVLAECGGTLAASLLAAGAVDKVLAFIAPKIAGGQAAPTPVEGSGVERMEEAMALCAPTWTTLGQDVVLTGYLEGRVERDGAN